MVIPVRALDQPNLGPKFGPIPNAKKYVFSQFQMKNSQSDQASKFSLIYDKSNYSILFFISRNKIEVNYWNQSSNGNFIHYDDIDFPNFSQNTATYPISMGPGTAAPFPKRGVRALPVHNLSRPFSKALTLSAHSAEKSCNIFIQIHHHNPSP